MPRPKRIVCLGGGNAMPQAVLAGLKKCPDVELSVISAMLDSGGSAGKERKELFHTKISFGDIRRASYALSENPEKDKFNTRISFGRYRSHVISNLTCSTIIKETNDYEKAIDYLNDEIFKIPKKHKVLPSTLDEADVYAELENGKIIGGEAKIDIPKEQERPRIKQVYLKPKAKAYPKTLEAIRKADLIVIGPGDLYSSLAQILLVEGIPEALRESRAKKVYLVNLMTKNGETNNFSVLDFVNEIEKYLEGSLDYVIYNNFLPSKEKIKETIKENPLLLDLVKINEDLAGEKFIGENLLSDSGLVVHNPQKLAKIILKLCKP